jgi:hypothetical protein
MAQAEKIPNTTRRGFLSGAAAAAVLPAAAVMTQPIDPIFAIVERCRAAFDEFGAASLFCDEVAAERQDRIISDADRDRLEEAADELEEAGNQLTSTAPATMAGLSAAIAWLLEVDEGSIPVRTVRFLKTLAQSPLLAGG